MARTPRVYLDTSAFVAGIWSAEGGARMILKLGEADVIQILINSQVLHELDQVLRDKAPELLSLMSVLLDRCGAEIVPDPDRETVNICELLVHHTGDAVVLGGAWKSNVDYFVTLHRKHFLDNPSLLASAPFSMGTPGDFIAWYRSQLP